MNCLTNSRVNYSPVLSTTGGAIRGFECDGVYRFQNIKYADARRFHKPVPASWEGVRDCTFYGFAPPLMGESAMNDSLYIPHVSWPTSEDCLNLNVWTSTLDGTAKLPVIVSVLGGSFMSGGSNEMRTYDGTNLARHGDVVFVTLNMRANILGFFNLACFGEEYHNSGNLGFEDVLCALNWVKANIEKFGGDPENVTLFGLQGGALRIKYIMQCPAFKGLFSKAFILSGVADHGRPPAPEAFFALARMMLRCGGFAEDDVRPLETMPLDDLHKLYRETVQKENIRTRFRLQLNGWCFGRPEDDGVCPEMRDITVVAGNTMTEENFEPQNQPEGRMPYAEFEQKAKARFGEDFDHMLQLYRASYPEGDVRDMLFYGTDHRAGVQEYADVLAGSGMKIYTYLFAPEFPINGGIPAFHCADTPYIMDNVHMVPSLLIPGYTEKLVKEYSGALISLAHNGTPAHGNVSAWAPYTAAAPNCMVFCEKSHLMEKNDRELVQLMEKHKPAKGPRG